MLTATMANLSHIIRANPVTIAGFAASDEQELGAFVETRATRQDSCGTFRFHKEVAPGDAAHSAACRSLEQVGLAATDLDYVISCTQTPDRNFPGVSSSLLAKLDRPGIPGLELRQQGVGALYAAVLADRLVRTGQAKTVLVACVEFLSRYFGDVDKERELTPHQQAAKNIFGDGAAAFIVCSRDQIRSASGPSFVLNDALLGAPYDVLKCMDALRPAAWKFPQRMTPEDISNGLQYPFFNTNTFSEMFTPVLQAHLRQFMERNEPGVALVAAHFPLPDLARGVLEASQAGNLCDVYKEYGYVGSAGVPMALAALPGKSPLKCGESIVACAGAGGFSLASLNMRVL